MLKSLASLLIVGSCLLVGPQVDTADARWRSSRYAGGHYGRPYKNWNRSRNYWYHSYGRSYHQNYSNYRYTGSGHRCCCH